MDSYYKFLNSLAHINENDFKELVNISSYKKIEKGVELAQIGKIPNKGFFIISGVARAFVTLESGKQYNKRLYASPAFGGDLTAMVKRKPSLIGIDTLTSCKLFEIDFVKFKSLCENNINICKLYAKVLEHSFFTYEERNIDLLTLSGTERYIKLQKQIPNIDELIPQYQIASYIGVSAVQLSRIRKTLQY